MSRPRLLRSTMSSLICSGPNSRRCLPSSSAGRSNGVPNSSLFVYVPSMRGSPHDVRGSFGALCAVAWVAAARPKAKQATVVSIRAFMSCSSRRRSGLLLVAGLAVVRLGPAVRAHVDLGLRVWRLEDGGVVDRPRDLELVRLRVHLEAFRELQVRGVHDALARLERRGDEVRRLDDERVASETP